MYELNPDSRGPVDESSTDDDALLDLAALVSPTTEWGVLRNQNIPADSNCKGESVENTAPAGDEEIDCTDDDLWTEPPNQEDRKPAGSLPAWEDRPPDTPAAPVPSHEEKSQAHPLDEEDGPDDGFKLTGPIADVDIEFFTEIFSDLSPRPRLIHSRQVQIIVPGGRKVRYERLCREWKIRQATLHNLLIARAVRALENPTPEMLKLLEQHKQSVIDRRRLRKKRQHEYLDKTSDESSE